MTNVYAAYAQNLTQKRKAEQRELDLYDKTADGKHTIEVDGKKLLLDSEDEHDNLNEEEKKEAASSTLCWDDVNNTPLSTITLPNVVDHRPNQTPIKDQADRGTCVCFAALANLEALFKAQNQMDIDLSEQYANWLFMKNEGGKEQCHDGLRTTLAAKYLSTAGVCEETLWPYEDRSTVSGKCSDQPSPNAAANAKYGIGSYTLLNRLGLLGPSIANTDYLEDLLYGCAGHSGYDIVFGTHVAWGRPDANGILDVILDRYGNPLASRGGHAMLMVGYDKTGTVPYFIVKNSWGVTSGNAGYYYLSYDYIRTYAKYGYVVHNMRTDMI